MLLNIQKALKSAKSYKVFLVSILWMLKLPLMWRDWLAKVASGTVIKMVNDIYSVDVKFLWAANLSAHNGNARRAEFSETKSSFYGQRLQKFFGLFYLKL